MIFKVGKVLDFLKKKPYPSHRYVIVLKKKVDPKKTS